MPVQQQWQQAQQSWQAWFNPFVLDPTGIPPIDFNQYIVPEPPMSSWQQQAQQSWQKSSHQFWSSAPNQQFEEKKQTQPSFSFDTTTTPTPSQLPVDFSFDLTQTNEPLDTQQQQTLGGDQSVPQMATIPQIQTPQINTKIPWDTSEAISSQDQFFSTPTQFDPNFVFETSSWEGTFQLQNDWDNWSVDTLSYTFSEDVKQGWTETVQQQDEADQKNTNDETQIPVFSSPTQSEEDLWTDQILSEIYFDLKALVEEVMEMTWESTNYVAVGQREPTNLEYIFTPTSEPLGLIITRDETFPDTGENTVHTLQFIEKEDTVTVLFQDVHLLDVAIDEDNETEAWNLVKKKLLLLTKLLRCDYEVLVKQRDEALKKQAIMAELAKF